MADAEKKYYYVCHHLHVRNDDCGKLSNFTLFETEEEAIDHAVNTIRKLCDDFDESRARGILATDGNSKGDSVWVPEWVRRQNGDRLTIIRTTHPKRYSRDVEKFLNKELEGNCGLSMDEYHMGTWIVDG